jgi:BirA family transcriptional regulator, biotin operon repressor / biotin---[acetyl-CoA-carboxylase] ligase
MPRGSLNAYDLERLRAGLRPIGVHYFPQLRSTSDQAGLLRRRRVLFAPTVVVAGRQTAGRGRGGRAWWSGVGSLTATFLFPAETHLAAQQVALIAGLALRDAVARLTGEGMVQLKWPNDLVYEDRKLAGLLCERLGAVDLIGVGINVNRPGRVPRELAKTAAWLEEIGAAGLDLTDVLVAVGRALSSATGRRDESPFAQVVSRYNRHHALSGRKIAVSEADGVAAISGICEGLDSRGRLLVRLGNSRPEGAVRRIVTGSVRLA